VYGFSVAVVAGKLYEVGDKYDNLITVGIAFKRRGNCCKPDHDHELALGTSPVFHPGKCASIQAYISEERDYGKSCIYQIQTLLQVLNYSQITNNPFPGAIFEFDIQ